ncbi:MAG: Flp pilus assembly protein CpaB [Deltaproteobacteria bacterium]|nr:Flp pilus assembly protein CpaB [Deltaproteobacteria bacterium]
MATGFGARPGASRGNNNNNLILLVVLLVLLGLGLAGILFAGKDLINNLTSKPIENTPVVVVSEPVQNIPDGVNVLVTRQRIEEGTPFDFNAMFIEEPRSRSQLPINYFPANRKLELTGRFAKTMINASTPLLEEHITDVQPVSTLQIPVGFRAITITVDARRGVEGWAKPNSRVDVLWTYNDPDGTKKVATIVRFVKVLSVAGQTANAPQQGQQQGQTPAAAPQGETTVTLLVEEREAKKIELARTLGELSLSLIGNEAPKQPQNEKPVTLRDIIGDPNDKSPEELPADGRMYTKDAQTGELVLYELRKGRWERAAEQ